MARKTSPRPQPKLRSCELDQAVGVLGDAVERAGRLHPVVVAEEALPVGEDGSAASAATSAVPTAWMRTLKPGGGEVGRDQLADQVLIAAASSRSNA